MSICGTTLTIALAALWVVFTPPQLVPPMTPATSPLLPHPPAAHMFRGTVSEAAGTAQIKHQQRTRGSLRNTPAGRLTYACLRLCSASVWCRAAIRLEKSPAPWGEPFSGELSVILDWSRPGYAPARPCPGQRWPTAEPLPVPAGDQYVPRK